MMVMKPFVGGNKLNQLCEPDPGLFIEERELKYKYYYFKSLWTLSIAGVKQSGLSLTPGEQKNYHILSGYDFFQALIFNTCGPIV